MNIFGCKCPYCDSTALDIDRSKRGSTWREIVFLALITLVGTISVSLHMRCRDCSGRFRAYKRKTYPEHHGYYFAAPTYRPERERARR